MYNKGMETETQRSMSTISRIHTEQANFLMARLREEGLPHLATSHGYILYQLSLQDPLSMKELASRINRDKSTTTALVRKLEREGLVKITASPHDARSRLATLTEKGKKYNETTSAVSRELRAVFYTGFSARERDEAAKYLRRVLQNFERLGR